MNGNHTRFLPICPVVLPKQQIEILIRSLNSFNCTTRDLTWKVLTFEYPTERFSLQWTGNQGIRWWYSPLWSKHCSRHSGEPIWVVLSSCGLCPNLYLFAPALVDWLDRNGRLAVVLTLSVRHFFLFLSVSVSNFCISILLWMEMELALSRNKKSILGNPFYSICTYASCAHRYYSNIEWTLLDMRINMKIGSQTL